VAGSRVRWAGVAQVSYVYASPVANEHRAQVAVSGVKGEDVREEVSLHLVDGRTRCVKPRLEVLAIWVHLASVHVVLVKLAFNGLALPFGLLLRKLKVGLGVALQDLDLFVAIHSLVVGLPQNNG